MKQVWGLEDLLGQFIWTSIAADRAIGTLSADTDPDAYIFLSCDDNGVTWTVVDWCVDDTRANGLKLKES